MADQEEVEGAEVESSNDGIIKATYRKTGAAVEFGKTFGATLQESVALYGEEVVHDYFTRQATIACQGRARAVLAAGGSRADAIAAGVAFVPGVITRTRVARDPYAELAQQLASGTISMADLEAKLKEQLAALGQ